MSTSSELLRRGVPSSARERGGASAAHGARARSSNRERLGRALAQITAWARWRSLPGGRHGREGAAVRRSPYRDSQSTVPRRTCLVKPFRSPLYEQKQGAFQAGGRRTGNLWGTGASTRPANHEQSLCSHRPRRLGPASGTTVATRHPSTASIDGARPAGASRLGRQGAGVRAPSCAQSARSSRSSGGNRYMRAI